MNVDNDLKKQFDSTGRVWFRNAVSEDDLVLLDKAMAGSTKAGQRLDQAGVLGRALSSDRSLTKAVRALDDRAKPVRVVSFDKSERANWGVPWHQDRVIAVAGQEDVPGYRNWTRKSGVWHCEPPQAVLEQMLFVRVHLDNADQSNGAMQIAVGSHARGIIPASDAESEAKKFPIEVCSAGRGDVLILKMLTLHCSKPAEVKSGRRVFRVDFSSFQLPGSLSWASADQTLSPISMGGND